MRVLNLALFALVLAVGCGEKITLPEAVGIPTSSLYLEQRSWALTDPIDVVEANGRIFLIEGDGSVAKYSTQEELLHRTINLPPPVALAVDPDRAELIVLCEAGTNPAPSVYFLALSDLTVLNQINLEGQTLSAAGIAYYANQVYLSDPDSQVVHRFTRIAGETPLLARGVVCNAEGTVESPQYIRQPSGLTIDAEGKLLVCDADSSRHWVLRFDPTPRDEDDSSSLGTAVVFAEESCPNQPPSAYVLGDAPACEEIFEPGPSDEPGGFNLPLGAAIDTDGRIYVVDQGNGRVQRFDAQGRFELILGNGAGGGEALGEPLRVTTWQGTTTRNGIPVTIHGARVYVVDRSGARLRVFEDKRWSDLQDG